jgi:putative glutamine amidotransferase
VNDTCDVGYNYAPFFSKLGECSESIQTFTINPGAYKLVVFTGGADVTPSLYRESSPRGVCSFSKRRDQQEIKVYYNAVKANIPMFGICRGIQFLNVMVGGKLIHDLSGHNSGSHLINTSNDFQMAVNSYHHQACIPPISAEILAWSAEKLSSHYIGDEDEEFNYSGPEVESIYIQHRKIAGVQWHPEAMKEDSQAKEWSFRLARNLVECTDLGFGLVYLQDKLEVSYAS